MNIHQALVLEIGSLWLTWIIPGLVCIILD